MTNTDWMWIWWVGTVALCLWKLGEAVIFRPARMLEWPFLACAMWLYFYGYMAYQAKMHLSAYLGNGISEIGQLMAFLSLIGLLAGWSLGRRVHFRPTDATQVYPLGVMWLAGLGFLLLGAVGIYSVMHASDEGEMDYKSASAYWYLLFYVAYPGLAIALWSLIKMKSWTRLFLGALTFAAFIAFILPPLINARRGPLFPAVIVLLLVPPMTLRRPPSRLLYCGGLLAAGLVMVLFLQVRAVTYNGGTWSEAIQQINVDAAAQRGDEAEDNEYVNSCQVIGTVFQDGKYQYGAGHLGLLVHWVPRAFWPSKPELGEGTYTNRELFDDVEQATGVRLLGTGASAAGVADSFLQYGVFCPLFWFVLSLCFALVYTKALASRAPWWLFSYVGFLCASHWLVSQSFSAAFVPAMYFEVVPLCLLSYLLCCHRRRLSPRRRFPPPRPMDAERPTPVLPS
jgi:hypothetical protein